MKKNDSEIVFISWAHNCSRSDNIARELGGFIILLTGAGKCIGTSAIRIKSPPKLLTILPRYSFVTIVRKVRLTKKLFNFFLSFHRGCKNVPV